MVQILVSAFAADFLYMADELSEVENNDIDYLHIDIMDGHFVPLFGFNTIWIRKMSEIYRGEFDIHFMTYLSVAMLDRYLELPSIHSITIHIENGNYEYHMKLLQKIRNKNVKSGIALSLETSLESILPYLGYVDEILLMSSELGRENSRFHDTIYERISSLKAILDNENCNILIGVDGGIDESRANICAYYGAGKIIIGRSFFTNTNKEELIKKIKM